MPINLNQGPIDPTQETFWPMFRNMQGHVLKHHGRNHTRQLMIRFNADTAANRRWVRDFTTRYVVSTMRQLREVDRLKQTGVPGGLFSVIYLTAPGYRALGFTDAQIAAAHSSSEFRNGLESQKDILLDDPDMWEAAYRGRQIHAMVVLADEDEAALQEAVDLLCPTLHGVAHVLAIEKGRAMRNGVGEGIEHFGYVDGRSQPLFLKAEVEKEATEEVGGIDQWDPSAKLDLVLVKDQLAGEDDCFGSYLVFRKLEQNVRGFKAQEKELAKALGLGGADEERAGALVVGRFEDGTPVTLEAKERGRVPVLNNFNFQADANALKCPFQAHIRKTNPRGDSVSGDISLDDERLHRIIRRGITYGVRDPLPTEDPTPEQMPTAGVGLLFQALQSNIGRQFVFMQRRWANSPIFVKNGVGIDPVVGQVRPPEGLEEPTPLPGQKWGPKWGEADTVEFDFSRFVTMRGGEIFFLPSIPFLRSLE